MNGLSSIKNAGAVGDLELARSRVHSVDVMRGLVMVVMALDHTRDYFSAAPFDPTDLAHTNAALFFTRWITHFCAPVFFFLTGFSAYLSAWRERTKMNLSVHLGIRGLWLILLEMTVVNFAWTFRLDDSNIGLGVLWGLGWSMVILAVLVQWPKVLVAVFGVLLILGHNEFDGLSAEDLDLPVYLWTILHVPGEIKLTPFLSVSPYYSLIPWVGVTATGYAFGPQLLRLLREKRSVLVLLGALLTCSFVILRLQNGYGDSRPWSAQPTAGLTFMSFLNTSKYPPSLLYLLMTLGPAIGMLPLLERAHNRLASFFVVFGRVPLFFYLTHLYVIHALAVAAGSLTGHDAGLFMDSFGRFPAGYGFSLPVVYAVWTAIVLVLYPMCRRFGDLRAGRRFKILSYL